MFGLVAPSAIAIVVAMLSGGSLSRWSEVRLRWWALALGSLLLQVGLFSPLLETQPVVVAWGPWMYLLTLVGVLAALLATASSTQIYRFGLCMAALGVALNCLVIVSNGGYMPRSDEAATIAGRAPSTQSAREHLVNVQPLDDQTHLWWLGDIIPQPRWLPWANVVSIGDLLLAGGLAWWAFSVTALGYNRTDRPTV
jgi:hypothetical protein